MLKYISKTSSAQHLWRRILTPNADYQPATNVNGYPITVTRYASYKTLLVPTAKLLDRTDCRIQKIKLITWSRGFVQAYLNDIKSNEPCPNAP